VGLHAVEVSLAL